MNWDFVVDQKITDIIKTGEFTLSAEVIPPRNGSNQNFVLKQVDSLVKSGCKFLAVTKGAGGSLRGGSLPIAQMIKETYRVPTIAHFTCRELNPEEIENQLMDHHYFGIRNILALRGDPPLGRSDWKANENSYNYAYQLIEQICNLNNGYFLERPGMAKMMELQNTDFCIGAAIYPESQNMQEQLDFFIRKIEAGAHFAITQIIYDLEILESFLYACKKNSITIPIIPGSRILTSKEQAKRICQRFNVNIPESLMRLLPDEKDPQKNEIALEVFSSFVKNLINLKFPGFHLFVLNDTDVACNLLNRLMS